MLSDKTIIILDGAKFDWTESEILQFQRYWHVYSSYSDDTIEIIKQIAKDMDEDADDIMLLASSSKQSRKTLNTFRGVSE